MISSVIKHGFNAANTTVTTKSETESEKFAKKCIESKCASSCAGSAISNTKYAFTSCSIGVNDEKALAYESEAISRHWGSSSTTAASTTDTTANGRSRLHIECQSNSKITRI